MQNELTNKRVKIFLKNKFVFRGRVINKDSKFIEILDDYNRKPRFIALDEISNLEVLEVQK